MQITKKKRKVYTSPAISVNDEFCDDCLLVSCGSKKLNWFKLGSLVIAEEILCVALSSSIWFVRKEWIFSSVFIWFDVSSSFIGDGSIDWTDWRRSL